ncbi:MAG: C45 family autoproteolytic acyltransferase/hydrolase [Planctomycetaceae bacterium]
MQTSAARPLAIIGMGCRLPGADSVDEFWRLLIEGRHGLGELPADRMDRELQYCPEKGVRTRSYSCEGGVANEQAFPRGECPLPEAVIDVSHTAHITLCNVAAAACRDAGLDPYALPNRNVGVYIGHTPPAAGTGQMIYARLIEQTSQYLREIRDLDQLPPGEIDAVIREIVESVRSRYTFGDNPTQMRANANHGPGLISRAFGLDGPSMAFDAACASSFRALGHGVRALQRGQVDMALVGGASFCHGDTLVVFSQAQSVSTNGSRPFDEDASGLVAAGGYVVLALKTLERALADGDRVQAVISGLGVSSDGKGKSLWAPRQEGQIEAIRRAYGNGMEFRDVQFLEMHATSTQVGDATELAALAKAADGQFPAGVKIPIGSVKANIGHTLETAGIASLLKTVLALRHGVVPPQINVRQPNSKIDWQNLPFFIPQQPLQWDRRADDDPRKAAVNAFGIGGLNVHVALQEFLPGSPASQALLPRGPLKRRVAVGGAQERSAAIATSEEDAVAIVGIGAIMPGARTAEALWSVFREGRDQKSEVPPDRWDKSLAVEPGADCLWKVPTATGGFVRDFEYDWKQHKVPPKQIAAADPLQFMLLDGADQALRDAGYLDGKPLDKMRTGVIVGTIFGGEFGDQLTAGLRLTDFQKRLSKALQKRGVPADQIQNVCAEYEDVLLKRMPALVDETGSFTASTLASRITKTFDLMGGAVAVDCGDASSMAAIQCSIDLLLSDDCDVMICAAGQRWMGIAGFESFARHELLSRGEPQAPFDERVTGNVPGEGVGVVVLKRLADARRDGDDVRGIIRGIGVARNDSLREGLREAMRRSMSAAGVESEQVAVIEAGANGVPQNDRDEALAVADAYGGNSRSEPLRLSAVAGQMGNLCGGSGMASLLKAVNELNDVTITGTVGLESPIPELRENASTLVPVREPSRIPPTNADGRLIAGVSSYSQTQVAYHLLLEGPKKVPRIAASERVAEGPRNVPVSKDSRWRIARFSGSSPAELETRIKSVNPAHAFADDTAFPPGELFRLAIVAEGPDDLQQKLKLAASQLNNPKAQTALSEKGIFPGVVPRTRPKVAFLFPGQGSQYVGMLKSLIEECPAAADARRQIDAVLAGLQLPGFAELAWNEENARGEDVRRTQLALLAADFIVYAAATSVGLKPDRVAGHSFGELVALAAAGSWTFEDAVRATQARCAAIDGCKDARGLLVSTNATAGVVAGLCQAVEGRISISHVNAPEQTVAGGDETSVRRLAADLKERGFLSKVLDVPAAFHTPLMEPVKPPFRRALEEIPTAPPLVPLLSSVTHRYVADPADIRDNLVEQMTRPINYIALAQRLADEGVTVMVEVGPRQVLTGLNRQILEGHSVSLVGCDHPKRNGLLQLLSARACVEVSGALDPDVDAAAVPIVTRRPVAIGDAGGEPATPQTSAPVATAPPVIKLAGTPGEIGRRLGEAQSAEIRAVLRRYADLAGSKWDRSTDVDEALAHPETYFGPAELEELHGMAAGAGVSVAALIAHNLRLYLDSCAGGTHFALSAQSNPAGGMLHAVNEDISRALKLRDCLSRNVLLRQPADGHAHLTFGVAGQVGTLCGINAHGVAVSTATLMDVDRPQTGPRGRLVTVLVKNILERAADVDAAVAVVRESDLCGCWTLCITHHPTDRVCYVEFDGNNIRVQPSLPRILATNHQQLMNYTREGFSKDVPEHSLSRLNRLQELLGEKEPADVTPDSARAALRDRFDASRDDQTGAPSMHTLRRVDNQISIVMQPAERAVWITPGPSANGHADVFTQLSLDELFSKARASTAARPAGTTGDQIPSEISGAELAAAYANADAPVSGEGARGVCRRFVMRIFETPLDDDRHKPRRSTGAVAILGENAAADALANELASRGTQTHRIPAGDDPAAAIAALEQCWRSAPAPHLFLMTALDDDAAMTLETAGWQSRRARGVMLPYLVSQRWFQLVSEAGLLGSATLTAATSLGGDFGFSGKVRGVEGGGLAGLVKGVRLELEIGRNERDFRAKIVDAAPSETPERIAAALLREWTADDDEIEVGYVDGRRFVVRPVVEPVAARVRNDLPSGANILVTGGARGITAVVARELGVRYGATLHLVGSSPAPTVRKEWRTLDEAGLKELKAAVMKSALAEGQKPIDAWARVEKALEIDETLRSFAEAGVQATYHACDISDRDALAELLGGIRAAGGPIDGIVHGAGFERATRFDKKKPELVDRTIAVKVDGAAALMDLTRDDPLKFFAAFGSVSGRFGGVGQTDYCVANDMLAKLVDWYRVFRPGVPATTFHWHAWDDVGMAMRPESKHIRQLHDIAFMPSREGTAHLLDELRAGLPEGEIVVTELKTCREQVGRSPESATSTRTSNPSSIAEASSIAGEHPDSGDLARLPLVDAVVEETAGELTAELRLDPINDVFLDQHRFKNRPLLPVVVAMEALAETASRLRPGQRVVGLRDIQILNGLKFPNDDPQTVRLRATAKDDGVHCELTRDFVNRRGQLLEADRPYLKAVVELADGPRAFDACPAPPEGEWHNVWYPEEDVVIYHGPIFRYLRQMTVDDRNDGWARLVAPPLDDVPGRRGGDGWIMPSAVLDGCFFACGAFLWHLFNGVVAIPAGIEAVRLGRLPQAGEECTAHIRFRERVDKHGVFDLTLCGVEGGVILQVQGYRNVIIAEAPAHVG